MKGWAGFCEEEVSSFTREKTNRGEGRRREGMKWRWREAAVKQLWGGEHYSQLEDVSLCPEASVLAGSTAAPRGFSSGFNLLGEGAPSGACWAWRAAAVSGAFLNPWGRAGEWLVWVLVFPFLPILCLFPLLYLVLLLVIVSLASISVLAEYDGAEMTWSGAAAVSVVPRAHQECSGTILIKDKALQGEGWNRAL